MSLLTGDVSRQHALHACSSTFLLEYLFLSVRIQVCWILSAVKRNQEDKVKIDIVRTAGCLAGSCYSEAGDVSAEENAIGR